MLPPITELKRLAATLWFQVGLLTVVVLGITVIWTHYAVVAHQKALQATKHQPKPAVSSQVAIQDGQAYLKRTMPQIDPRQRLVLDFLYRKFKLQDNFSAAKYPIVPTATKANLQLEYDAIARIAYPDRLVNDLGSEPSLVTRAANCDHIPLPADFSQQLEAAAGQGGYELTHVAFSLQITKDLGCSVVATEPLTQQVREGMIKLAGNSKTLPDLRYESIAFLGYMGFTKDIKQVWIDTLLSEQRETGEWIPGNVSIHDDHSTTVALWALLEYTQQAVPKEPLIRH